MNPLPADRPVGVTLTAQQWNVVLGALGDAPYRVAAPVIQQIVAQVEASQAEPEQPIPAQRPNGADEHAPH